jgi:hypothetical protein
LRIAQFVLLRAAERLELRQGSGDASMTWRPKRAMDSAVAGVMDSLTS